MSSMSNDNNQTAPEDTTFETAATLFTPVREILSEALTLVSGGVVLVGSPFLTMVDNGEGDPIPVVGFELLFNNEGPFLDVKGLSSEAVVTYAESRPTEELADA